MMLSFKSVSLTVGQVRLFDNINFALAEGQRVAVVGQSGAGKSLLHRMSAGLACSLAGEVRLLGTSLKEATAVEQRQLRGQCGILFQKSALISGLSVEENLWLALPGGPGSQARFQGRLDRLALDFEIEHLGAVQTDELSAGERRRVELARVFLRDPALLLFDEPLEGCLHHAPELIDTLERLIILRKRSMLLVTQDRVLAERLCDQVFVLSAGKLFQQRSSTEFAPSGA